MSFQDNYQNLQIVSDGEVRCFRAEQISTGAMRALKIIKPELLNDPKLRQRFEQEANS